MQTFMPYSDYIQTSKVLDWRRLGKQRVEAKQILQINLAKLKHPDKNILWQNHPAVLMWRGYEPKLAAYGIIMCCEWIHRGYNDTTKDFFVEYYKQFLPLCSDGWSPELPFWYWDEELYLSHQSNLVRKNPEYYRKYFPEVPDNLPYYWPVKKE